MRVHRFLLSLLALAVLAPAPVQARVFKVCAFSFHSPDELEVFKARLPPDRFEVLDLSPHLFAPPPAPASSTPAAADARPTPWILNLCRADLTCDVVVYSAEFAGRFFGKLGSSLSLQDMEEASCQQRCRGLFHDPQEVFLLACNTLATKDQDSRTPDEYLRVLLEHGFDRASAERVVELRYGPLGPSFRESLRRIFMGVPRVYGFSSVAPIGLFTAPMLQRYFSAKGDYAQYLTRSAGDAAPNRELLSAMAGTGIVQIAGLRPSEPGATDRDLVCQLYDDSMPVADRLEIIETMVSRDDFLSFVPTIEVFFNRHAPAEYQGDERRVFEEIQDQDAAREQVLRLVHDLNVSVIKMEIAHLALHLEWLSRDEFRNLAVSGAKELLTQPLTSEVVDITCEITKHEPLGDAFSSADLPGSLFGIPEGLRLIDCLSPDDEQTTPRLLASMNDTDVVVRLWAAFAVSRRLPLSEAEQITLASHLNDPSTELRERLRWTFRSQGATSEAVLVAVRARDPELAASLVPQEPRRRGLFR
ncbi:MAG TPA: hypothetical protein VGR62_18580 [Candidatus Binatia bacterium]|jgi:hypothetical protein|nr:hypothetical protein [Candidatus Binatia bacterium]